jgi:MoxR-like ATPase
VSDETAPSDADFQAAERAAAAYRAVRDELGKVIVGQTAVVDELLVALFAGGHCLLLGVPGLAKTLMVRTLADALDLSFNRVQFTPDLMPADITGTEVLSEDKATGTRDFRFVPGPVFANVVLADEINRTPPKTQAALLEAMQERQVTAGGRRHPLPSPFFVLATQNPIEQEGTYPLPEAQLDRFMFEVKIGYPTEEEEFEIVRRTTRGPAEPVQRVLTSSEIQAAQNAVRSIPIPDHVVRYAMRFARLTPRDDPQAPDFIRKYVSWGAGPRASQFLVLAAKARAMLQGRLHVAEDDVQAIAKPVLRHRIVTNFDAEADGLTSDDIVDRLTETIPVGPDRTPGWVAGLMTNRI